MALRIFEGELVASVTPCIVFGTRPEAIKVAPILQECDRRVDVTPLVVSTGQHREMLAQVIEYFGLRVDVDLSLMKPDQTLSSLTARCVEALDSVLVRHRPDCVVAQGDTTTVLAAALVAFYHKLPFVHVEAGLRTGNLQAPWPEEFNRRVAGISAALHCAPTERAAQQLLAERVPPYAVHRTGNTVVDALLWAVQRERERHEFWDAKYSFLGDSKLVLLTGHRRENFGDGFEQICLAIRELARSRPELKFIYPVHLNPRVQEPVHRILNDLPNVRLQPPATYAEFVWLMDRSHLILTDSGGVQEEALSLRKPVLVMRETTERPEGVEAGAVELVGTSSRRIVDRTLVLLEDPIEYAKRQLTENPYGDGQAARRIVDLIARRAWESSAL
jgi:UDP-N-acetylglucosamine 2-epimerase (non-hydrolysing)